MAAAAGAGAGALSAAAAAAAGLASDAHPSGGSHDDSPAASFT